jgi:hypothetical protein
MINFLYILAGFVAFPAGLAAAILGMQTEAVTAFFLSTLLGLIGLIVDKSES